MCVPYSFVVTKEGDIFHGLNLDHHTDICQKYGLKYDDVLKPEYQIWNREIKDLELVELTLDQKMAFPAIRNFYDKDGFLKNRFASRVKTHIDEKFTNWKDGLEYFESNWGIVQKYATRLVKSPHLLVNVNTEERQWLIKQVKTNFEGFITETQEFIPSRNVYRFYFKFACPELLEETAHIVFEMVANHVYYHEKTKAFYAPLEDAGLPDTLDTHVVLTPSEFLAMKRKESISKLQAEVLYELYSGHYKMRHESGWEQTSFDKFKAVFEQQENRIECWAN